MNCLGGRLRNDHRSNTRKGMEYWRITTVDDKGNNALTGGMMKRMMPEQQGITNYIDVKSVREYSAQSRTVGRHGHIRNNARCQVWVISLCAQIQRIMRLLFGRRITLLH